MKTEIIEVNLDDMNQAVPFIAGQIKQLSEQGQDIFIFKFKNPIVKHINMLNTMLVEANYFTTCLFEYINNDMWYYIRVQIKR